MVEIASDFTTQLRRIMPLMMAGLGVFFIVAGILVNYLKNNQKTSVASVDSNKIGSVAGEIIIKTIKVDISGAIERPGVYSIPYDSRVADVLITAGGLSPNADRNYISRYINLAQRTIDGMKIYFPAESETNNSINQSSNNPINYNGLININLATSSELDGLPGIGIVTANKIITGRPYQNISELISRKIITNSIFEKIKDKISI